MHESGDVFRVARPGNDRLRMPYSELTLELEGKYREEYGCTRLNGDVGCHCKICDKLMMLRLAYMGVGWGAE